MYKRQAYSHAVFDLTFGGVGLFVCVAAVFKADVFTVAQERGVEFGSHVQGAVSYTHLDVYKRQGTKSVLRATSSAQRARGRKAAPVSYTHLTTSYFETILHRVSGHLHDSAQVIGTYMCQGKMPMSVRARYEKMLASPDHAPNLPMMIENFDRALSHPDADDLAQLKEAVHKAV